MDSFACLDVEIVCKCQRASGSLLQRALVAQGCRLVECVGAVFPCGPRFDGY